MNNLFNLMIELPLKESIKLLVGNVTCLFGMIQFCFLFSSSYKEKHASLLAKSAIFSILLSSFATNTGRSFLGFLIPNLNFLQERVLFVINPWHPKHVVNILSFILTLSILITLVFKKKKEHSLSIGVTFMLLFNALTSRPFLHIAHQLLDQISKIIP